MTNFDVLRNFSFFELLTGLDLMGFFCFFHRLFMLLSFLPHCDWSSLQSFSRAIQVTIFISYYLELIWVCKLLINPGLAFQNLLRVDPQALAFLSRDFFLNWCYLMFRDILHIEHDRTFLRLVLRSYRIMVRQRLCLAVWIWKQIVIWLCNVRDLRVIHHRKTFRLYRVLLLKDAVLIFEIWWKSRFYIIVINWVAWM